MQNYGINSAPIFFSLQQKRLFNSVSLKTHFEIALGEKIAITLYYSHSENNMSDLQHNEHNFPDDKA